MPTNGNEMVLDSKDQKAIEECSTKQTLEDLRKTLRRKYYVLGSTQAGLVNAVNDQITKIEDGLVGVKVETKVNADGSTTTTKIFPNGNVMKTTTFQRQCNSPPDFDPPLMDGPPSRPAPRRKSSKKQRQCNSPPDFDPPLMDGPPSRPAPRRPVSSKKQQCRHWLMGSCTFGNDCRKSHVPISCRFGTSCRFKDSCKNVH
jgi:hypothetical protein